MTANAHAEIGRAREAVATPGRGVYPTFPSRGESQDVVGPVVCTHRRSLCTQDGGHDE